MRRRPTTTFNIAARVWSGLGKSAFCFPRIFWRSMIFYFHSFVRCSASGAIFRKIKNPHEKRRKHWNGWFYSFFENRKWREDAKSCKHKSFMNTNSCSSLFSSGKPAQPASFEWKSSVNQNFWRETEIKRCICPWSWKSSENEQMCAALNVTAFAFSGPSFCSFRQTWWLLLWPKQRLWVQFLLVLLW